jgi:predicted DNA-binding transcriptional regulator YafY
MYKKCIFCDTIKAGSMKNLIEKTLSVAAVSAQPVKIIYQSDSGITQRIIEIKNINSDQVVAYCRLRRRISTFRLENILAAQIVNAKQK